jgi:uncharacterized damage-inducible protein DinB
MSIGQGLIAEFDAEMKTTRRMLERVPGEKGEWKPHPKSFPLGHLAQLVSWMPGWIAQTLTQPRLDLSKAAGYSYEKTETLVDQFDRNVADAHAALENVTDEEWGTEWSLTSGDKVFMKLPKGIVVRQHISHLVHHRGQLSVYLRLLDVPVPSIYGPTADEPWGSQG